MIVVVGCGVGRRIADIAAPLGLVLVDQ